MRIVQGPGQAPGAKVQRRQGAKEPKALGAGCEARLRALARLRLCQPCWQSAYDFAKSPKC